VAWNTVARAFVPHLAMNRREIVKKADVLLLTSEAAMDSTR